MFRYLVAILIALALVFFSWPLKASLYNDGKFAVMKLKGVELRLELVERERDWYNGLSNRPPLCSECGMLFNFFESSPKTFVMREMNFPLDILWFNRGELVGISANLKPESKTPYTNYNSRENVDQVLEVNAGLANFLALKINDRLE